MPYEWMTIFAWFKWNNTGDAFIELQVEKDSLMSKAKGESKESRSENEFIFLNEILLNFIMDWSILQHYQDFNKWICKIKNESKRWKFILRPSVETTFFIF